MDILIFIFALFQLFRRKYSWVLASIVILASNYLVITWGNGGVSHFPFNHQVSDTGLILYVILFLHLVLLYGFNKDKALKRSILLFFFFLVVNGVLDIQNGVSTVDVVKYCRSWIYLSIIWIKPDAISSQAIIKCLKILLYVVLGLTIIIIYQNLSHNFFLGVALDDERGIKPSLYVIVFTLLLFFNSLQYPTQLKWIFIFILFGSIVLNLKQTYLLTVILSAIVYLIIFKRYTKHVLSGLLTIFIGAILFFSMNTAFRERIDESLGSTKAIKRTTVENTFSFRIIHAWERLDYITKTPYTAIRGVGFVHENSWKEDIFLVGSYSHYTGRNAQLDTADIAWSVLFIRFGFVGTFLFIVMYISVIHFLYSKRTKSSFPCVLCAFLIVGICFMALGNAEIIQGYFYIIPILSANIASSRYL
jgi:hypothetical protein